MWGYNPSSFFIFLSLPKLTKHTSMLRNLTYLCYVTIYIINYIYYIILTKHTIIYYLYK